MEQISTIVTITGMLIAISATPVPVRTVKNTDSFYKIKPISSESGKNKLIEIKEKVASTTSDRLKQKASNEITRRAASLTNVKNKITEMKRLTENQKNSLIDGIQSEITNLTELNKKIQLETNLETLRTYVKSIISSHRTYLLFLPKTQIIIAANAVLNAADKLDEFADKLLSKINEAKSKGEDTTEIETSLADIKAKITDAKTQANNSINVVFSLQPTNYPDNKPNLQSVRTKLQAAHKDLITVKQKAQEIIVALKKLNKNISGTPINETSETKISPTNIPDTISNTQIILD